ncbi:MAG: 3-oxoacyl-ACP reductase FabG [Clostridia bacterium]|nr:3-oxoacyl-ACP reductase FabG [Clostridia bacterium]
MNILVTGGSRGIGAACVKALAAEGHRVAFFYRNNKEAAERVAADSGAFAIQADVSDSEAVAKGIAEAEERIGPIDALVCNAGISQSRLFTEITDEDFRRMCATNLDGAFYAARDVARGMVRRHFGRIVFIGSMWGKSGAACEVHYSATKAALRGMTTGLAKELGPSNITVNCIEPGVIDTDMNKNLTESDLASLIDDTPLCRVGTPEDIANAVSFFLSDKASFITGQMLGVDGGFAI